MSFLPRFVDERFLNNRLRSTSAAGICTVFVALALFLYRYFNDHVLNWDLFAIGASFAVIKVALMIWFSRNN
jgi:hypothetical protein